jgi:NhaP-type Na+/H+ or K+/H+ antiporter
VARVTLKWAEQRDLVDHDNFLAYGVGLTFFILGTVGLIGSDDILCCFVAGNAFTWDDWFRVQTEDHAFQDVIDTLLNSAIFLYIGSILPWSDFGGGFYGIQPWRLVVLGISVMALRRVPWVVALVSRPHHEVAIVLLIYRVSLTTASMDSDSSDMERERVRRLFWADRCRCCFLRAGGVGEVTRGTGKITSVSTAFQKTT